MVDARRRHTLKLTFTDGESTIEYFDPEGRRIHRPSRMLIGDVSAAEKGGFPISCWKESFLRGARRTILRDTACRSYGETAIYSLRLSLNYDELKAAASIARVYHRVWHELPCGPYREEPYRGVEPYSLRSRGGERIPAINPIITPSTLVVAVSQSGETADTLAAIRDARIKGREGVRHHQCGGQPCGARRATA